MPFATINVSNCEKQAVNGIKKTQHLESYLQWPRELNALQLKKTHANRKSTSKLIKHLHHFDSTCCKYYCTTVCVHLDGLNAEHNFRVWVTMLGHTSLHLKNTHNSTKYKNVLQKQKRAAETEKHCKYSQPNTETCCNGTITKINQDFTPNKINK